MILSETGFFQGIESEVMNKIAAVSKVKNTPKIPCCLIKMMRPKAFLF